MRIDFVRDVLNRLLRRGVLTKDHSILAVCAGDAERSVFSELGFRHVLLSNLDERMTPDAFPPFRWEYQDVHALTYADGSFDFTFVADGLHHCDSPHRALLEMYRVSRRGIVVVESRDSLLMRLSNRLGLSPNYELEAVVGNECKFGGVNNTPIPNYIYRWTERDFEKTLSSYAPQVRHTFLYFYGLNLPFSQAVMRRNPLKYMTLLISQPLLYLFTKVARRQCNTFAMIALRPALPEGLWPWLKLDKDRVVIDEPYVRARFKTPS
jgi:SAM-dependent methyltransferase